MAAELFPGQKSPTSPTSSWEALTPSDTVDFTFTPKAVAISSATGGSFIAVGSDSVTAPFYGVPGQIIPIQPKRINVTGMTVGMTFTGLKG